MLCPHLSSLDCQLKKHRMTLEVELVWFGCQTCSDPLLFYHLSGLRISPGSSLFQIRFGCATTNNMHVCTPVCVCESLPAVKQQVGPGSAFLIDLQVTGCVRGLIASLSAPHLPSFSSIQSLSFLSLFLVLSLLSSCQRSGAAAVPGVQLSPRCFFSYASQTVKELFACVVFMWFAEFWHKKLSCSLTTCNPV